MHNDKKTARMSSLLSQWPWQINHPMQAHSLWPSPPSHSILWDCMTCVVALESYLRNPASMTLTLITSNTQTSHSLLQAFPKKSSVKTNCLSFLPEYLALRSSLPKNSTAMEQRAALRKQLQALTFDCVCHFLWFYNLTHSFILLGVPLGQSFWWDNFGCPCWRCNSTWVS